jgi:hypothetical protein
MKLSQNSLFKADTSVRPVAESGILGLVHVPFSGGATMPEFTTVSVQEAKVRTLPGRQGTFLSEYADYIQQLPRGQAGRLRVEAQEKPMTVRRRLAVASQALGIPLIIKRSGSDIYFWRKNGREEQPRPRRGRRPRREENAAIPETPEQYFKEEGELQHGVPVEDSPELGQTPV